MTESGRSGVRPIVRMPDDRAPQIGRVPSEEAAGHPGLGLYLLRPPIVLGPDASAPSLLYWTARTACPVDHCAGGPAAAPGDHAAGSIQFIHEDVALARSRQRSARFAGRGGVDVAPSDHGREQSHAVLSWRPRYSSLEALRDTLNSR